MNLVIEALRSRSSDPSDTVIWVFSVIVFSTLAEVLRRSYKERAAKHDHVAEVDRDVAIPDHCVACGRPHPTALLEAMHLFIGVSAIDKTTRPELKLKYRFRYCAACARPVKRRRAFGRALMIAGGLFFLHMVSLFVVGLSLPTGYLWDVRKTRPLLVAFFSVTSLLVDIAFGGALVLTGYIVSKYSPNVKIVDYGEETIFFSFTNQVFRNHFAELNGGE